jgi:translation elongation factor EF-G
VRVYSGVLTSGSQVLNSVKDNPISDAWTRYPQA